MKQQDDEQKKCKVRIFVTDNGEIEIEEVVSLLPIHAERRTIRETWAWYLRNSPPAGSA